MDIFITGCYGRNTDPKNKNRPNHDEQGEGETTGEEDPRIQDPSDRRRTRYK